MKSLPPTYSYLYIGSNIILLANYVDEPAAFPEMMLTVPKKIAFSKVARPHT